MSSVPPSTSMATPKPRIVVWESNICAGVITGWSCADCEDEDCEHECHQDEPAGNLRDRLRDAIREAAHQCSEDCDSQGVHPILLVPENDSYVEARPVDLADAALPVFEAEIGTLTHLLRKTEDELHEQRKRAAEQHDRAVLAEAALRDHGAKLAAEMRYGQQQYDRAENAEATVATQTRILQQVEQQRDDALAALTRHAAEAHRRKWAHEDDNQAAFDSLHRLGDEILASRDRLIAGLGQAPAQASSCSCDGDPIECSHEAARGAAEAAVERVRRLQEMTIAASCRVEAINQARDTLAVLEPPKETT